MSRALNVFEEDLENISRALVKDFTELKNKNILLTGGTGFVGTWLVFSFLKFALELNSHMFLVSRNPENFLKKFPALRDNKNLHFIKGDVRDFAQPTEDIHYVIHAATDVVNEQENFEEILDTCYLGTKRVLELCRDKKIKKYLYISSGAVYGRQPPEMTQIREDYLGAPSVDSASSAYGEGKRLAEWLSCQAGRKHQFEVKRARGFAVIGPHLALDKRFAVGNFIGDVLNSRDIIIKGDGTVVRSYMYASDMTIWLWTILFRGQDGEAYNVGSDQAINLFDLAKKVAEASGAGVSVKRMREPQVGVAAERYVPGISKALGLGLRSKVSLEVGIGRGLEFFRDQEK